MFTQFSLDVFRREFEGQAKFFSGIGSENANTTAVGDDQEIVAFHRGLEGERQCGIEHVI